MVISANYMLSPELGEGGDPKMDKACFLPPREFSGEKRSMRAWLAGYPRL